MTVEIVLEGGSVRATAPFDAGFVKGARALAGSWQGDAWSFPASQEGRVRELCRRVYGTDGSPVETVTLLVRVTRDIRIQRDSFRLCGRVIAWATGRDSGARLGGDIVHLAGRIGSGGSRQYWTTEVGAGAEFEMLNLPRPAAEAMVAAGAAGYNCEIVDGKRNRGSRASRKEGTAEERSMQ